MVVMNGNDSRKVENISVQIAADADDETAAAVGYWVSPKSLPTRGGEDRLGSRMWGVFGNLDDHGGSP
jgi:hypothetical protein